MTNMTVSINDIFCATILFVLLKGNKIIPRYVLVLAVRLHDVY